ncbi:MAG: glycosyltransferase [Marmoricola sp.]
MRVLHVSEAFGGGVVSSLLAMVESTPEVDHHLLAHARPGHDTGVDLDGRFASVGTLAADPVRAVVGLRRQVRDLFPDVVHAHSSIAGAVVRLAGLDGPRIVYSPHCFAFERRDLSRAERLAYTGIERLLARRTDLLVAVAPHEMELAAALGHQRIAYTPNRTTATVGGRARFAQRPHVVAVGRICRQKDWRFLLHTKRYAEQQLGLDARWTWLGGGDPADEARLGAEGVEVTGWMDRGAVLAHLSQAQVYLHTAAWEAAPISVLEAAALGLPLALRSIPPLRSLALPGLADSVPALAGRLVELGAEETWTAAQRASLAVAERHSRRVQGEHLLRAYADACGVAVPAAVRLPAQRRPAEDAGHGAPAARRPSLPVPRSAG